jgi:predicted Zn-dependent peptidase
MIILTEEIPHVRSVSAGVWITTGSKYEAENLSGISHFIEHMMFKGTARRSAKEIAESIESVGGQLNAFTGREYTCFYAVVLDEHLPLAVDVLADMLTGSLFDPAEMEKEKNVVLEEIKMYEDSPDDLIHDKFAQTLWDGHPLGRSILGPESVIKSLRRKDIISFLKRNYASDNVIISLAGNLKHQETVNLLNKYFGGISGSREAIDVPPPRGGFRKNVETRDLEQVHFCIGTEGPTYVSEDRYAMYVLNSILGGNSSSRLFQEVREKLGLVYSIYSYHDSYKDGGLFAIYAGVSPENFGPVLEIVSRELSLLKKDGIKEDEFLRAKEHLKGSLVLSLEETSHRMSRLAKSEIYFGRTFTIDEILRSIESVSMKDVSNLVDKLFGNGSMSMAAIGPLEASTLAAS